MIRYSQYVGIGVIGETRNPYRHLLRVDQPPRIDYLAGIIPVFALDLVDDLLVPPADVERVVVGVVS